jgi:predicted N-acetyltransferase YhbS
MEEIAMTITFKPYFDSDFIRIRDFLSRSMHDGTASVRAPGRRPAKHGSPIRAPWNWWIDRWNFTPTVSVSMHRTSHETWANRIGIWELAEDGAWQREIVGLVLTEGEGRGECFIQSGPEELPDSVLEEMFDFIEERFPEGGGDDGRGGVRDDSVHLRLDPRFPRREAIARRRGFTREEWSEPLSWLPADRAPAAQLPSGYSLALGRDIGFYDKGLLHARAFGYTEKGDAAIAVSGKAFERLTLAPDYRPELDLVALDANGEPASMVGLWYDRGNGWGILEPVGTARAHQKRGLGKALIGEGMKRLAAIAQEEGARFDGLWVGSDQPFYLAVGFTVMNRWGVWEKERERKS